MSMNQIKSYTEEFKRATAQLAVNAQQPISKEVLEMTRKTRKYSNEFKQEAIHLALKSPSMIAQPKK